jgi:hypothetical protein
MRSTCIYSIGLAALSTFAVASVLPNGQASTKVAAASGGLHARANSGRASFYGGNTQGGQCSFSTYTLPDGIYGTALSSVNFDNAAYCGACVDITGPLGNNITALVRGTNP